MITLGLDMSTNEIAIGSQVQRRTGPLHTGKVVALREGQAQVQWQSGARVGGGEYQPTVWTALDSIKIAGTNGTAHQTWCKDQSKIVNGLIKQALTQRGGGSLALAEHVGLDLSLVRHGKVRAKDVYETAIKALRAVLD